MCHHLCLFLFYYYIMIVVLVIYLDVAPWWCVIIMLILFIYLFIHSIYLFILLLFAFICLEVLPWIILYNLYFFLDEIPWKMNVFICICFCLDLTPWSCLFIYIWYYLFMFLWWHDCCSCWLCLFVCYHLFRWSYFIYVFIFVSS